MFTLLAAQVYWLHVSYLQVAAAALRSGAQLTALLYLEHWCEEQLGACTVEGVDTSSQVLIARKFSRTLRETSARVASLSSCDIPAYACRVARHHLMLPSPPVILSTMTLLVAQDGIEMKRILLDIYSSIDDPDGIYAVAQSGDTASQLRLMQHEGARQCIDTICALSVSFEGHGVVMQTAECLANR